MSLVVDALLTMSWYFDNEGTPATESLFHQVTQSGGVVPALWPLEVVNAFQVAIRRKRIDAAYRDDSLSDLARLPIEIDPDTDTYAWTATLKLSDRFGLSAYDAAYLELGQRRNLPLGSLDGKLRAAGRALGLTLLGV